MVNTDEYQLNSLVYNKMYYFAVYMYKEKKNTLLYPQMNNPFSELRCHLGSGFCNPWQVADITEKLYAAVYCSMDLQPCNLPELKPFYLAALCYRL